MQWGLWGHAAHAEDEDEDAIGSSLGTSKSLYVGSVWLGHHYSHGR